MSDNDETIGGRRRTPTSPEDRYQALVQHAAKLTAELADARDRCMGLQQQIRQRNLVIDGLIRSMLFLEERIQALEEVAAPPNSHVEIAVPLGNGGSGGGAE